MKKVININLGGRAFIINEDAYSKLDKYLKAIERHFSGSDGMDDILYDIENRIAELFEEDEKNGTIITIEKIEKVKSVMGRPEDFGGEEYDEEEAQSKSYKKYTYRTGKRLFRDPDDQVIAGVASGLSAYFGINDPIILRIVFVILGLSGVGVLPYIILWIAVPAAKTSSDRL
ncbi:MAG: PspC domain-containing protein, partial [Saprospiraceae bacterium]|nr:PspC domain-containing protein [Saprospiraceae bacterium]